MSPRFASLVLASALGIAGVHGLASAQQAGGGGLVARDLKIGAVDLASVYKQYKRSADLEQMINEKKDLLNNQLKDLEKEIKEVWKALDLLDPQSEAYQQKEDEKDMLVAKFDRMKKRRDEVLKKTWENYNLQLLDDIEKVVKAYGEDNKFTLILKIDGKPTEEQRMLVGLKAVLYSAKELDITPAIVELLNRNYDKTRNTSAPGGGEQSKPGVQPIPPTPPGGVPPKPPAGEKK